MPKTPAVDRARYPHDYVGPITKYGLALGPCRIIGRATGGGKRVQTPDGRKWLVGAGQVQRAAG